MIDYNNGKRTNSNVNLSETDSIYTNNYDITREEVDSVSTNRNSGSYADSNGFTTYDGHFPLITYGSGGEK